MNNTNPLARRLTKLEQQSGKGMQVLILLPGEEKEEKARQQGIDLNGDVMVLEIGFISPQETGGLL